MTAHGGFASGFGNGFGHINPAAVISQLQPAERGDRYNRHKLGMKPAGIGLRRITVEDKPWTPVTKLGRLVKDGRVTSIEDIYLRSIPILEYQIVDILVPRMKDSVLKIIPVRKELRTGMRTRFRAFVAIGDCDGHVGLGVQCAKRVSTAIRRAVHRAKTAVVAVRRAFWRHEHGTPHTIPCKVVGRYFDAQVTLLPAPRGAGVNAPPVIRKLLILGGIQDCYCSVLNCSSLGPLSKAAFMAIQQTYFHLSAADQSQPSFTMQWRFISARSEMQMKKERRHKRIVSYRATR